MLSSFIFKAHRVARSWTTYPFTAAMKYPASLGLPLRIYLGRCAKNESGRSVVGCCVPGQRWWHFWARMCAVLSHSVMSDSACDPMDYSLLGSSVLGILQARILEWVAFPFSRGSSRPRGRTQVSHIAGGFFTVSHQGSPWTRIAVIEMKQRGRIHDAF